ncbi:MAG: 3-oxoacyl-[acyl-carrier-protein] synthase [Actinomycetia bacterium]|nr:3-oxoacyl-[acyl-carrier-protein] synthase [Actinomycetes bacterium]
MAEATPGAHVVVTGVSATSAFGRGSGPLLAGALSGQPAFSPVRRFGVDGRRAKAAAELDDPAGLADELAAVIDAACDQAGLRQADRASTELLMALHSDAAAARDVATHAVTGSTPADVAARTGLPEPLRVHATACIAGSAAIADAAAMIASGRAARMVVSAGFLVDPDSFALFDGGRVLARDGQVRPFSSGRQGMLLGDGVAAVVLESSDAARSRDASPLARLAGWGRAGDAYHVCQPSPDGRGLARAIDAALRRGRTDPADIDYVNAGGTGTSQGDSAEAAALRRALGSHAGTVPVSSTKSVHGHALEASGLLEFVLTVLVLGAGLLPPNAGYLGPDPDCDLDLVLGPAREVHGGCRHALSVNAAFGGANTALLVAAP